MFAPKEETMNINFKKQLEEQLGRELTDEEFGEVKADNIEYDEISSTEDEK